jgi:epoxide hydrolase 4
VAARAAPGGPGLPGAAPGPGSPADPAGRLHGREDIDRYVAAAAQPGALRAAVNYYRAAARANPLAQVDTLRRVDIPTLIIWGDQDRYLGRELAEPDSAWVPDVRVERISEASHWLQADAPERVNQLMLDFLESIRG